MSWKGGDESRRDLMVHQGLAQKNPYVEFPGLPYYSANNKTSILLRNKCASYPEV